MSFPTTSVLDNFNRADEGPPPSDSWSFPIDPDNDGDVVVVSNECTFDGFGGAYWSEETFGPDTEVYITASSTSTFELHARMTNPGFSGRDGYLSEFNIGGDTIAIYRVDNNTATQLGDDIPFTLADGDVLGLAIIGSAIIAYVNGVAVAIRTDDTYTTAGYIGVAGEDGGVFDDFGGGTRVYATSPPWRDPRTYIAGRPLSAPQMNTYERDNTQYLYDRLSLVQGENASLPVDMGNFSDVFQQASTVVVPEAGDWFLFATIGIEPNGAGDRFHTRIRDTTHNETVVSMDHCAVTAAGPNLFTDLTMHTMVEVDEPTAYTLETKDEDTSHSTITDAFFYALRVAL